MILICEGSGVLKIEILRRKCIDESKIKINLSDYKKQYFPVINDKGEKEVWANCFCHTLDEDWRKNKLIVMDDRNCYFHVIINLVTETNHRLIVNGYA